MGSRGKIVVSDVPTVKRVLRVAHSQSWSEFLQVYWAIVGDWVRWRGTPTRDPDERPGVAKKTQEVQPRVLQTGCVLIYAHGDQKYL